MALSNKERTVSVASPGIFYLPAELLAEIFLAAIDYRTRGKDDCILEQYRTLMAISQTNSVWRQITLRYSSWWGQLLPVQHVSHTWFRVLLDRSGETPLHIISGVPVVPPHRYCERVRDIHANWSAVFKASHRFKHVFIRVGRSPLWNSHDFEEVLDRDMPLLESFTLLQDSDQGTGKMYIIPVPSVRAPVIKTLQLRGVWPLAFIHGPAPSTQFLSHLYLHNRARWISADDQAYFTVGKWKDILHRMPSLVSLSLVRVVFGESSSVMSSLKEDASPVVLPSLEYVKIVAHSRPASSLLSTLSIPTRCKLKLIQIADDEDVTLDSYARDLALVSNHLMDRVFDADGWFLSTRPNFVLSARAGSDSTLHFETSWTWARRYGSDFCNILAAFTALLHQFSRRHSRLLSQARVLGLDIDNLDNLQPTPASHIGSFVSRFHQVETLYLDSVEPIGLGSIRGQEYSEDGHDCQPGRILPRLKVIRLDPLLIPPNGGDPYYPGLRGLLSALAMRTSQPVDQIHTVAFLVPTSQAHRFYKMRREIIFGLRQLDPAPKTVELQAVRDPFYQGMNIKTVEVTPFEVFGYTGIGVQPVFDNIPIVYP